MVYTTIAIKQNVKKALELCKEIKVSHNPQLKFMYISNHKILCEMILFYAKHQKQEHEIKELLNE